LERGGSSAVGRDRAGTQKEGSVLDHRETQKEGSALDHRDIQKEVNALIS
jgi:hypothetical protein